MKRFTLFALLLNATFLFFIWRELSVAAQEGGGAGSAPCEVDRTLHSIDSNGDGKIGVSDAVHLLRYLFIDGSPPQVCLAQDGDLEMQLADLRARMATLEGKTTLSDLDCAAGEIPKWDGGAWSCAPDKTGTAVETAPAIAGFTFVETNAQGYPEYTHDSSGIRFVRLPGSSFNMGSPASETGHNADEGPVHTVSLSPFLIAKYEVTQAEYETVMTGHATLSATPSFFATGANLPVEQVSWNDVHAADGFLERTGLSLPTEAQWEYACRAGTPGPFAGTGNIDDMGWYLVNSGDQTHDVGTKQANQFGLHDLHGNLFEWCEDVFKSDYYADDVPGFDPLSTTGSPGRTVRGGGFFYPAGDCRSAPRYPIDPGASNGFFGFRAARPLP